MFPTPIESTPSAANSPASEPIQYLPSGFIIHGSRWSYRIIYQIGGGGKEHNFTVFKAEVIPHNIPSPTYNAPTPPQWAVIKIPSPRQWHATGMTFMECERLAYSFADVNTSGYFRQLYQMIDHRTLALEWMDTTLDQIPYQPNMRTFSLILIVLKAVLESCVILDKSQHVNANIHPRSIYLSNINTNNVTVKIVFPSHCYTNTQLPTFRAPEIFLLQPCTSPAQVWSVGATILYWIRPGILGPAGVFNPIIDEAWCMAKLKRLFPEWNIPAPEGVVDAEYRSKLYAARGFCQEIEQLMGISSVEGELRRMGVPKEVRDVVRLMMVLDPGERPLAREVLESKEMRALEGFVGG
ncbi:hypothetical protein ASPCADRAFT_133908 [Aspergillus carbonarius ITEM 5010]|uniref:Protein kinase domain-containing protein n=1 Tax=Aspergillus carbonarius (strain ITEM 5010) TaxID=602072 RepID=A0A1R3RBJ2_ASPC5|nr:hypothetical protein ASPCADRAFT_133908 [Aspergillus carbonarius ITEM 5010]